MPARSIRILPSADALPKPEVVAEPQPSAEASAGTLVVHSTFWRRASEILGALWLLTLLFWWLSRRSAGPSRPKDPEAPPVYKQQSRLVKQARRAARESDAQAVKAALLDWGRLQWPEYAPRSIADLATRVSEPLASELHTLGRISYGPGRDAWDGAALDRALRSFSALSPGEEEDTAKGLPPLMPRSL